MSLGILEPFTPSISLGISSLVDGVEGQGICSMKDRKERILSGKYFQKTDTCWIWIRALNWQGYGCVWWGGKVKSAHRVIYELLIGEIPTGLTLDHLCKNKACVNPAHLEPVTMAVNVLRADGACALNKRKDRCKSGHLFDKANTIMYRDKYRRCRECKRRVAKVSWARRREKLSLLTK